MKKLIITAITVFFLISSNGIQAQNVPAKLDQIKLMQTYLGTWQANVGKDTVEVAEIQQYGKAFIENVYHVIKGNKMPYYINNIGFDPKQDKFKGFTLWPSGNTGTWIGYFANEKKYMVDFVRNFNPEMITSKLEMLLESPKNMTMTYFNKDGGKTGEYKFIKIK